MCVVYKRITGTEATTILQCTFRSWNKDLDSDYPIIILFIYIYVLAFYTHIQFKGTLWFA